MQYAIVENNIVVNIAESEYAVKENWVLNDGTAKIGYIWDGQGFYSEPTPSPTKEELLAELAALTAKIQALE